MQPIRLARPNYRPSLDGLRALCIIFTLENHLPIKPIWLNGSIGVDVFFALSGWLITSLLMSDAKENGRINLINFYIRRFFRIVPLYYMTVFLYFLASLLSVRFDVHELAKFNDVALQLFTFNGEYRPEQAANKIFLHAWTLGIEEKFYLLWPIILVISMMKSWRAFIIACVVSTGLIAISAFSPTLIRGYCGLAFGAGLAVWSVKNPRVADWIATERAIWIAAAFIVGAYVLALIFPHPFVWNLAISLAAAFLVGGIWLNTSHPISRWLSVSPLPQLGKLTFALYLLHVFALKLTGAMLNRVGLGENQALQFVAAYLAAVVLAYVAYRAVERPMIRFGRAIVASRLIRLNHGQVMPTLDSASRASASADPLE